ncbi:MAG: acyl-CoA synthetase, partial [Actinobacteria bacterium]
MLCGDMTRTWAEFDERAARLASWLQEQGVRPGDNVAIDMTNRPEYLEVFVGTLKLGATPVNVNYRYLVNETHYVLDNSDAVGVICAPEFVDTVRGACDLLERARGPWVLVLGEPYEAELRASAPTGEWSERPPSGDDLIIVYTG